MAIDYSVFRQTQKSGLRPTDSRAFTASATGLYQLGQSMQDVGQMGVQYVSAQQALHNDNLFNEAEQKFDNEQNKSLIDAQFGKRNVETGERELLDPQTLSPVTVKRLKLAQQKILKSLPAIRRNKFLTNSNAKIEAASVKAYGFASTRIQSQAKALDIEFKNNVQANAFLYKPEVLESKKQEYVAKLARGVISGVYDPDDAVRLEQSFKQDVADTLQNAKTSALLKTDFTVEQLEQRDSEIRTDPDLDPKTNHTRADNLWRSASTLMRQKQIALEKQAKQTSDQWIMKLIAKLEDHRLNPTGSAGLSQEDLDEALPFIREPAWAKRFEDIVNKNKAQFQLGDEDDSPAQGYLNELETLESKALNQNWSDVQLSKQLEELKTKAKDEFKNDRLKKMTSKELVDINSKSNALLTNFRNEGKRNMAQAKNDATKTLKFRLGGGDKAFDQFNSRRNELVSDAIESAHLLIERGMDDDKAVEKVLSLVESDEDEGIQSFDAEMFATMLKKASKGQLSEDLRYQLGRMILRAKKNPPQKPKKSLTTITK